MNVYDQGLWSCEASSTRQLVKWKCGVRLGCSHWVSWWAVSFCQLHCISNNRLTHEHLQPGMWSHAEVKARQFFLVDRASVTPVKHYLQEILSSSSPAVRLGCWHRSVGLHSGRRHGEVWLLRIGIGSRSHLQSIYLQESSSSPLG